MSFRLRTEAEPSLEPSLFANLNPIVGNTSNPKVCEQRQNKKQIKQIIIIDAPEQVFKSSEKTLYNELSQIKKKLEIIQTGFATPPKKCQSPQLPIRILSLKPSTVAKVQEQKQDKEGQKEPKKEQKVYKTRQKRYNYKDIMRIQIKQDVQKVIKKPKKKPKKQQKVDQQSQSIFLTINSFFN